MEGGSLFNPGFLGGTFLWWVGQIADDSTWRKNKNPGKFSSAASIPGWGERYKVRIIGLHDQGESVIPSEELPWAQIMYPVTAGGGQARSNQTSNLRQGMMVFGFFMDGQDQQIPVIMGVLGNNAATPLAKKIGDDRVTNEISGTLGTSGYASGKISKAEENAEDSAPDSGFLVEPNDPTSSPPSKNNPNPPRNFTNESAGDATHIQTIADVRRSNKYRECIPLMKPDDPAETVSTAVKAIQTLLDTLVKKIDGFFSISFVDNASGAMNDPSALKDYMKNLACQMAKYVKILTDKILEYTNKLLNQTMTDVVSAMPSHLRFQFADIKEESLSTISCVYSKLSDNLCSILGDILSDIFDIDALVDSAKTNDQNDENDENDENSRLSPSVPICSAETLVSRVITSSQVEINDTNNNILNNINTFLDDMQSEIAGVSDSIDDIISQVGDIAGGMTAALQFGNLQIDILGCSVEMQPSVSDCYQFSEGSTGQFKSELPSIQSVSDAISELDPDDLSETIGFLEPPPGQRMVSYIVKDISDG